MTTAPVAAATTATAGAASASAASRAGSLAGDFANFLTLLTAQLQNQDPTNPLDTNEFTTQLVQFALVEQQINANSNLETLISLSRGGQVLEAASLIGTRVVASSKEIALQGGSGEIRFTSDSDTPTLISVLDRNGAVLRSESVSARRGENAWTWYGRDARNRALPDGAYTVTVVQPQPDGTTRKLDTTTVATVTGAERQGDAMRVRLGSLSVGLEDVVAVGAAAR